MGNLDQEQFKTLYSIIERGKNQIRLYKQSEVNFNPEKTKFITDVLSSIRFSFSESFYDETLKHVGKAETFSYVVHIIGLQFGRDYLPRMNNLKVLISALYQDFVSSYGKKIVKDLLFKNNMYSNFIVNFLSLNTDNALRENKKFVNYKFLWHLLDSCIVPYSNEKNFSVVYQTISFLSKRIGVDRKTITRNLRKLEQAGLISYVESNKKYYTRDYSEYLEKMKNERFSIVYDKYLHSIQKMEYTGDVSPVLFIKLNFDAIFNLIESSKKYEGYRIKSFSIYLWKHIKESFFGFLRGIAKNNMSGFNPKNFFNRVTSMKRDISEKTYRVDLKKELDTKNILREMSPDEYLRSKTPDIINDIYFISKWFDEIPDYKNWVSKESRLMDAFASDGGVEIFNFVSDALFRKEQGVLIHLWFLFCKRKKIPYEFLNHNKLIQKKEFMEWVNKSEEIKATMGIISSLEKKLIDINHEIYEKDREYKFRLFEFVKFFCREGYGGKMKECFCKKNQSPIVMIDAFYKFVIKYKEGLI